MVHTCSSKIANTVTHVAILVVWTIVRQSRRDPGIPGLGIRQSRIPGLKIQVRDCNPYRLPISGVSVSVFDVGIGIRYFINVGSVFGIGILKYRDIGIGIGIRYFAIVCNFWSNKATAWQTGNSRFENANSPLPAKEKIHENSRSVICLILHALRQ